MKKKRNLFIAAVKFLWQVIRGLFKVLWWVTKKTAKVLHTIFMKWPKKAAKGKMHTEDDKYSSLHQVKNISGSLRTFENKLTKSKSTVGIILGARGSGKSAIGMRIIENIHTKTQRKIYAMGFNPSYLPEWVKIADDLNKIENNSFIIIDEGGITFSSRNSMSEMNKLISSILLISRHKDLSVIFITQNSSNLEINTIRQADYLIMKPHSLLQLDFERQKIKDIYKEVEEDFKALSKFKGLAYVYSNEFRGFVSNRLPSFWSSDLSKSFKSKKL